ncbi:MAG: GNAT family N-acetyltransferase [Mangrovicoccus sp.]
MTTLTTERLTLRPAEARDYPGYRAYYMSQRSRYTNGPKSETEAWKAFCVELAHWQMRGYGSFAMTLTEGDDRCIGMVGPWYPHGWPEREIGWLLWPEAEGKGLAYEAAFASRAYAYETLKWDTAVSYIDELNDRSKALATRLGAKYDPGAATLSEDTCVYRHPSPEELRP